MAAELIGAQSGLGYMIQLHRQMLATEKVMAGMVTIGAVGYLMNVLLLILERRLLPVPPNKGDNQGQCQQQSE